MRYEERKSERRDKRYPAEGREELTIPLAGILSSGLSACFFRSGRERFFPQSHSIVRAA